MRFLRVCVVVLSGLLAVRCLVFTLEPMKTAVNILRGVLANDQEWKDIICRRINLNAFDADRMLIELGLTDSSTTKITPQKIIERLIVRKGSTGSQLMFGVRVLGIALENQFVKTLAGHSLLVKKYAKLKAVTPLLLRVAISNIQQSLVVFTNKVAFFGHNIDIFWILNDIINEFFEKNNTILNDPNPVTETVEKKVTTLFDNILNQARDRLVILESYMEEKDLLEVLNIKEDIDLRNLNSFHNLINDINHYKMVDVSTFRLEFGEKIFKITKYTNDLLLKKEETETT